MGNQESVPEYSNNNKKKINQNKKPVKIIKKEEISNLPVNLPSKIYYKKKNNDVINDYSIKDIKEHEYSLPENIEIRKNNDQLEKKQKIPQNDLLIKRNMNNHFLEEKKNTIFDYPKSSNTDIYLKKPDLNNIKFTPYNFNEEANEFKKSIEDETAEFDLEEKKRRGAFENNKKEKIQFLEEQTRKFEEKYNPWNILQINQDSLDINEIKKGYKKMALKYHPDKAGDKYSELFQIITQSYIYLLKKAEENNELEIKTSKKVEKIDYEDNINDTVENIYVSKDKFDINNFNKIFEKYKVPDSFDNGYSDLMKEDVESSPKNKEEIFGKQFNKDIFNSHFDNIKKTKKTQDIIEYHEPDAIDLSAGMNPFQLGVNKVTDFGYSNSNNLSYTDYKKAHFDENLLIDANKIKYNTYNSVKQLENERSKISYSQSSEDKRRYEFIERSRLDSENTRLKYLQEHDNVIENQFNKLNQKLIVHK
jgi:hypothetical protein